MNPTAIYSKSGKGVQEASGKTSLLKRPDRMVLSAIDGRATLADVAQKVGKTFDPGFEQLIVQLDKDGFIREVSAGTAPAAKPGASAKPAAKAPARPAATEPMDVASDLDFSSLAAVKPASPAPSARPAPAAPTPDAAAQARAKEQQSALSKAREEAEAKAQAERDRIKGETESKIRAELESKARAEAEAKIKAEAESRAKGDADAKVKAAREAAVRAATEAKAKAEAEAKVKVEAERKAREETERKAREESERLRKQLEEERKAREEAERKAKEEAERARKQLEEERRKLEEERKREEQERAARRKREEEEEQARRKKREEEEQRAEAERAARRKQREEEEERQAEEERAARRKQREQEKEKEEQGQEAAAEKAPEKRKAEIKPEPKAADGLDSLLADLDSFTQRDEDERKASEEAERKAKAEAERRAREEAERQEREESERKAKDAERSQKEDEKRRRKEDEEQLAREQEKEQARLRDEEESRKREADERARKAKEDEALTRKATAAAVLPVGENTDEVRRRMVGKRAAAKTERIEAPSARRKPGSWGKPVAITLVLLLAVAIGVAHVMPISTEDYERAAGEALGRPVKIGSARLSLMTGLQLHFKDVKIGDGVTIAAVAGSPEFDSLRGEKKIFSRIDLEGVKIPQEALGEVLFARVKGDNFAVGRVVVKQLELEGPVSLPKPLEADLAFAPDGKLRSATLRGPDTLLARITPKDAAIEFEMTASGFPLPVVPEVTLSDFGMKGTASERGMSIAEWGGKLLGGSISGTANVRWGMTWNVEGLITVRNINAAVFAPTLLSEGKGEGSGKFSMSGAEPSKLAATGRVEGSFTVSMGVLGSFDLARAIQSSGKTVTGRTQFAEMNGQAVYDRGAVALRNVTIGAGALNAGASADIAQSGALSGRIVADMRTANQTLRATLNLGGTVKEPQVRN